MTNRLFRSVAIATTVLLALSACVTTGGSTGGPVNYDALTTNERALASYAGRDYVSEYAAQAGLAGGVGGALVGCLLGQVLFGDCKSGAALGGVVGGVAGAAAGASMGRETQALANRQMSAEEALKLASDEVTAARTANQSATRIAQSQTRSLQALRGQLSRGTANRAAYEEAIKKAKETEALIGGSRDKARDSIIDIQNRIQMEKKNGRSTASLEKKLKELRAEEKSIDKQLGILTKERKESEKALTS